jgi:hypothetical protein
MNFRVSLSLFCFVFLFSGFSFGQIDLDRIAKEAQRNVNRRVEKNIDKSIDNAMDNAEDSVKKKKKKKNKKGEETYEPEVEVRVIKEISPNEFKGKFMMDRSVEGRGDSYSNMLQVVMDDYKTAVRPLIIKEPHNLIIYDKEEETVVTINNENYEGKAMKDWYTSMEAEDQDALSTATKTDDIKEIEGYIARRYEVVADDYSAVIWFTKEIDADVSVIYSVMDYDRLYLDKTLGFPLEMVIQYNDDRVERVKITNIQENEIDEQLFDISGYELIDMTDLKYGK